MKRISLFTEMLRPISDCDAFQLLQIRRIGRYRTYKQNNFNVFSGQIIK